MPNISRRNFLKASGVTLTLPLVFNSFKLTGLASELVKPMIPVEDRILILVNLAGGNDGLNTLIPLDQYVNLEKARGSILIPDKDVIKINNDLGFHPSFSSMKKLYDEEKLCAVQNVGYSPQNQSHFRSTDIWNSASDAKVYENSGWLGRYFTEYYPDYPNDFPNAETPHPLSLTMGSLLSQTCQGKAYNMGMAINGVDDFIDLPTAGTDEPPETTAGEELSYIRTLISQTNKYFSVIEEAVVKGKNLTDLYPATKNVNRLADQLKLVAQLISGGLKTQVYVVTLYGFDTHANQVDENSHTTGNHARLLALLSEAIYAFQDDIKLLGVADRVIGMTYTEFGRRIMANASFGCDHGAAGPLFVFGNAANPVIIGENPQIASEVEVRDNLPNKIDFRAIYASILKDWFKVDKETLNKIMFKEFEHIPVIDPNFVSVRQNSISSSLKINKLYPNPVRDNLNVSFYTQSSWIKISIIDIQGREVTVLDNKYYPENEYNLNFYLGGLIKGAYLLKIQNQNGIVVKNIIVE